MADQNQQASPNTPPKRARTTRPKSTQTPGSLEARRRAAAVLEVLAGSLQVQEASTVLNLSGTGYYHLEARALSGLVAGCEPPSKGKQADPKQKIVELQQRIRHLEQEVSRYQSLARATQRAAGIRIAHAKPPKKGSPKRSRRKAPTQRALKLAAGLKAQRPAEPVASTGPKSLSAE